jgi:hypothetical protein
MLLELSMVVPIVFVPTEVTSLIGASVKVIARLVIVVVVPVLLVRTV